MKEENNGLDGLTTCLNILSKRKKYLDEHISFLEDSRNMYRAIAYAPLIGIGVTALIIGLSIMITNYTLGYSQLTANKKEKIKTQIEQVDTRIDSSNIRSMQTGYGKSAVKYNDYTPFGSIDEVVKIQDGHVITLRKGDVGFQENVRSYNDIQNISD